MTTDDVDPRNEGGRRDGETRKRPGRYWRGAGRAFRISRSLVLVLALTASLAANAALFAGAVLHNVIDEVFEKVTGLATETGRQTRAAAKLKGDNDRLRENNRRLKGRLDRQRKAVLSATQKTIDRSRRFIGRSVVTLPAKVIPLAGLVVVPVVTVWGVGDLCKTLEDMNEIRRAVDPTDGQTEEQMTICSVAVPTKAQILAAIEASPEKFIEEIETAWEKAKALVPDLPPLSPSIMETFVQGMTQDIGSWFDRLWGRRENDAGHSGQPPPDRRRRPPGGCILPPASAC